MTDQDDRILVSRFLSGRDEAAFRDLYRRHTPFLYRFLLRLSGGRAADAEEGVQETWVRAAERLAGFEGRSALKTWLAGIAIRWWREEARRGKRETTTPDGDLAPMAPVERGIERVDLERGFLALAEGYRSAILLHDVEGYTHDEIAEMTGVDAGTSRSQLSRARRALRAHLSGRTA